MGIWDGSWVDVGWVWSGVEYGKEDKGGESRDSGSGSSPTHNELIGLEGDDRGDGDGCR